MAPWGFRSAFSGKQLRERAQIALKLYDCFKLCLLIVCHPPPLLSRTINEGRLHDAGGLLIHDCQKLVKPPQQSCTWLPTPCRHLYRTIVGSFCTPSSSRASGSR